MDFTLLDWFRVAVVILSLLVAVWLVFMSLRNWSRLDFGQKLWATGATLIMLYVADVNRDLADEDHTMPWWRAVLLVLGLIAYFAYLLEPRNRKILRLGKPTFH